MNTITHKYVAVIAFATLLLTTAAPKIADACGFYSDEQAAAHIARWMFWTGPEADLDRLAKQYPKVARAELAMLPGKRAKVRTAGVKIDGKRASALVEVDGAALYEVKLALETGYMNWVPVSIRRATASEHMALKAVEKASALTRQLARSASAKLAKR